MSIRAQALEDPVTKTAILLDHLRSKRDVEAVALAATFRMLPTELRKALGTARAARLSPHTYRQMKRDPDALHAGAVDGLREFYANRL